MVLHEYETDNQRYPYCCRIHGTIKTYITAQTWARECFEQGSWTSTWTSDHQNYQDDQQRDWLFLFKSRDNYIMFMLTWHNVPV